MKKAAFILFSLAAGAAALPAFAAGDALYPEAISAKELLRPRPAPGEARRTTLPTAKDFRFGTPPGDSRLRKTPTCRLSKPLKPGFQSLLGFRFRKTRLLRPTFSSFSR